ncbi:DUF262 domain-containing protein [Paludicola sp. MB14-C6]|uniref:DUF262 domain-containing protein n=1 Tax=Paludihabitans sp. MB14-C6 TaxID=3070656 RepID=UPI0027DD0E45|nr:DUF262 domain-containing protein [Paludicola sp. MB14-C6]WMJ22664.1 DUF262 domain-containing protein [Paludicola sp. MB14-C6]
MDKDIYSFYELVQKYKVKVPIIQRDYAQGREKNVVICENFLRAIKESIRSNKTIDLDFIYGNVEDDVFLPLDGQQRLTTLFLLHWYAFIREVTDDFAKENLKKFSYETRLSSRRFCEALLENSVLVDASCDSVSGQILDSKWFFISWKNDSTIRAMLRTIDTIHSVFRGVDNIWNSLVNSKNVVFHLLILENFGLSDDLYIKMNARGRLLTPFENLKAEIQDKSSKCNWEEDKNELDKFSYKIDEMWTNFLWHNFKKCNSVDNAHMNFITTIVMAKLSTGQILKGAERIDVIRKLNENNSDRELIKYIDKDTFNYIYDAYELYCNLYDVNDLPSLNIDMWRHTPEHNLLYQILLGYNTSYTHKVLFYAQTEYLLKNRVVNQELYCEWMRVVRNIVSRADLTADGKRSDRVRSPEAFYGAINLVRELAAGCSNIYSHLINKDISSSYEREQVKEEIIKAKIINRNPEQKELIFKTEDNEILRGKISFALECANFKDSANEIDFKLLEKVQKVFEKYFNRELDNNNREFDKFRRAMLTIDVNGKYQYYNYWWSYWYAGEAEKRKLFPLFREIEYFIGLDDFKPYFKKLITQLISKNYNEIISGFVKPDSMENWQYRLIKEENLLFNCDCKYIAISQDRTYCYLLKSKRPSDTDGSKRIK